MAILTGNTGTVSGVPYTAADGFEFQIEIRRPATPVRRWGWTGLPQLVMGNVEARGRVTLFVDDANSKPPIPTGSVVSVTFQLKSSTHTYACKGVFTSLGTASNANANGQPIVAVYEFIGGAESSTDTVT